LSANPREAHLSPVFATPLAREGEMGCRLGLYDLDDHDLSRLFRAPIAQQAWRAKTDSYNATSEMVFTPTPA
jgi:hypothetical protein